METICATWIRLLIFNEMIQTKKGKYMTYDYNFENIDNNLIK